MTKIYKIINIALIFTLIVTGLGEGISCASSETNLRPILKSSNILAQWEEIQEARKIFDKLDKTKDRTEIIQGLRYIEEGVENKADALFFDSPRLLRVLNNVLRGRRPILKPLSEVEDDVARQVFAILDKIFKSRYLSQKLTERLSLYKGRFNSKIKLDFFDGDDGESFKLVSNNFPEILSILKSPEKTKDFILLLSLYRLVNYSPYMEDKNKWKIYTPLEYAIKRGIYISLGNDLYVTPISESFRRHVIFRMDRKGRVREAIEIFIPGDYKEEGRYAIKRKRLDVCRDMNSPGIIKTHLMVEYPKEAIAQVQAYGDFFTYSKNRPMRMFIFDYSVYSRGRRLRKIMFLVNKVNVSPRYLKRITEEIKKGNIPNGQIPTKKTMIRDILEIFMQFETKRYYFNADTDGDMHLGNFRLCLDGRVRFVNDSDTFKKLTSSSAKRGAGVFGVRTLKLTLSEFLDDLSRNGSGRDWDVINPMVQEIHRSILRNGMNI